MTFSICGSFAGGGIPLIFSKSFAATFELCASPYTRTGVVLPGGHHHSVKGVCTNDPEVEGSRIFEIMRSTRERYRTPVTSNSGASASVKDFGLFARAQGILILTDPVFQGPPAMGDSA